MNDQQQSRADALTEEQIRAFAEGACEYEIGRGVFRQNVATVGNVILAIRNALNLAASANETGAEGAMDEAAIRKSMTPEQIRLERKLTCEAIDGAMAFGYQNTNPPPSDDHWLAPFWKIGRKQYAAEFALHYLDDQLTEYLEGMPADETSRKLRDVARNALMDIDAVPRSPAMAAAAPADERTATPWWHALAAAADAVARSADVWAGFSIQDAKVCVETYDRARAAASPAAERVTAALQALSADVHTLGDGWANDEAMIGLAKKYLRVEPKPASLELSLWRDFVLLAVTDTAPQPAQPDAPEEAFPYQKTFNAIAAATSVEGGHVSISVKAFRDAFGGAVAEAREPIAWVTDDDRAITAAQKQRALADGGATASSVRPYSIPCYAVSAPADAGEAVGSVTISKPGDSATGISFMSLNEHGRQTLGKGKHLLYTNAKSSTLTVGRQQTIGRAADTLEFHGLKTEATELRALLDSTQQEAKECACPNGDGSLRQPCPVHPPTQTSADLADDDKRDAERYRTHVKYEYETIYMPAVEKKGQRPLAFAEYKASADQVADAARTQESKS